QYLANEEYFAQVFSFFEESGSPKLRTRKDFKNQEEKANRYLLAVIVRVNQLQAALSQTKSAEEVEVVIKELNDFRQHFNSKSEKLDLPESIEHVRPKPFATQYLTAKLRLIVPLINDRLLVPVIYRLVDEGIVTKENSAYHRLAEILKILRKKQLVTASDVSFLLSLFPESESNQRSKLRALILQVMPWMLGGDIVSAVGDEEKKEQPHHLVASIRTEAREMQDMVQNTLTLLQPKLILSAIITHLDHHIQKIERLKSFSEELNDVYEAKLIYCNTIKELLLGVLGRGSLSDHKKLAKALMEMSVGLPAIPAYGKGDMAKLFFRVANEFGPVSGGGDGVPLVEKILNFILNEMDSEVLTTAYDNLKRAYASRNKVIEGNDHDDLSLVWFEEESADPFDMSVQGGRVARVVILKYMDALIGEVYSRSGLDGVLVFFKGIPGYAFISNQLSHYIGKALTKEKVIELICSILGVQVHPELHEQDYMTRLSHAFFKVKAMQGGSAGLKEKIELTGLAAQPEELEKMSAEVDRLMQLTGDFSFNPLADPRALAEIAFQNAGEFREHQIQLLLVHCEYLVKYAKRLSDEAKRSTILLNVTNAMEFCSAQDGLHDFLTTKQAGMVLHLLEEGKAGSRDAAEQAKNSLIDTINTVKGQLKKEHDGVIRRATRKLTPLNIVGLVGYYLGDLGSLAYTIYSLITPVLAFVSAVKAMSTVTFQALSLAAGGALITSPVGLAILALRFVGGLAWHAYHCRQDFRKDWRASQSALGKAGVIAKYSLIVLGKALVSTFLSAALVDTAVGLIKKVRGLDIPFVNFIKDKLNVRAKLHELQNIKTTMQVLRGCVMDNEAFDQAVVEARKLITGLKYHADKANEWNKQIDQAVQHRDAFRGFSAASSTDELVAKRLKANPATKPTVPLPAWDGFVEAGLAGEGVTHFAFDVNLPDSPSGRSRVSVLNGSVFNGGSGGSVVTGLDPSREAQDVSSVVLSSSP
ncbi:MAG TPA: hypothetical protein VFU82_06875, partial [Gammaproteobacteria bacterium]|nr:hypothetical protein [Gammaproteobacteria bacterium]